MDWNTAYPFNITPTAAQIAAFIGSPLWDELCRTVEARYGVSPKMEHSRCGMAPGWNIKYRKGGKSVCTLYPNSGFFSCMVVMPRALESAAELLLPDCTRYVRELYRNTRISMGGRWLFIDVTDAGILYDALRLIDLRLTGRIPPPQ
ncbi:MAG: DUF3788 domain-containing protein [Intestinibacillus sp.]